ncbi:MAG: XRE family transcriptional regulator [bacterium]
MKNLGDAVKRRRNELELSLSDVAARSGVSAAMLSEVERGQKSPTIRVLSHIAEALTCSISDLLGENRMSGPRLARAKSHKRFIDPESGIERVSLSDELLARGIEVLLYRLPGGEDTGPFAPHRSGVQEHLTVLRGALEIHVGSDVFQLRAEDSISYAANASHRYRNVGKSVAEMILVIDSTIARPGG